MKRAEKEILQHLVWLNEIHTEIAPRLEFFYRAGLGHRANYDHLLLIKTKQRIEARLKQTYPFGYKCLKLLERNDPRLILKIRKYTRKVLGESRVSYKDGYIEKGLFSQDLGA